MRRLIVLGLLAASATFSPAQVRNLTLSELCSSADRILVAGITKIECRWEGQLIVTDLTIAPLEVLKGVAPAPFLLTVPGGTMGAITLHVSEMPTFVEGELSVLFLKANTPCGIYGWHKGKYTVVNDQVTELPGKTLGAFRSEIQTEVNR